MDISNVLNIVDHTSLSATARWEDIQKLCEEAIRYHTASVCIPPAYVERAAKMYGKDLTVCTVIGFPLGYSTKETKVYEAADAVKKGAKEVDMVVNLGDVKDKKFDLITEEIRAVKEAVGSHILKVIIETCYLTEEEKIHLCECVTEGGADYIKTSTGFGTAGAQLEDIELFKQHIGGHVKMKASGGIREKEDFEKFYNAGVHRIGASSAMKAFQSELG